MRPAKALNSLGPELSEFYRLFHGDTEPPAHVVIPAGEVPEPYHSMLVHPHHMTVTVEAFYDGPVNVRVLARRRDRNIYARKILLTRACDGKVVQFGVVRIHLDFCSDEVKAAILEEKTPLGRILIEYDVLRRIEPTAYLRIEPGPALSAWFGLTEPTTTYGRLGFIHCDEKPAVELLEILAPVPLSL